MQAGHQLSWRTVIKSVLMGVSVSLVTPNRVGEYFGRAAGLEPEKRTAGVLTTLLGGLAQNLVTWTAGILSVVFLLNEQIEFSAYFDSSYLSLVVVIILIGFVTFFRIGVLRKGFVFLANRIEKLKPYVDVFDILEHQGYKTLIKLLGLSAFRYCVYASQYILLLYFLGIDCSFAYRMAGVAFIFFIQASLPLPAGLGLVMRGNVSLLVWGTLCTSPILGVAASYLLFIINFSVTAFLGVYFFFKSNISFKRIDHADNAH